MRYRAQRKTLVIPMRRFFSCWMILLTSAAARADAPSAWMEDAARRWETQKMVRKTLPNGVRLLVLPQTGAPWCGMATVFPGGGASSPLHQSGLPHLAEHLMFEEGGHAGPSSHDVDGEAMGLRSNAFTLGDYTVLVEEFSPAVLNDALRIHAARLTRLSFDDAQLAREKSVVADERRFRVDEPALGRAEELLISHLWGDHAWGWPVLGFPHHLAKLTRSDVINWVHAYIRPERAVVVLSGAVDPQQALNALEAALAPWQASTPTSPIATQVALPPPLREHTVINGDTGAYLWAVEASALGGPHEAADRVLAALLTTPHGAPISEDDDDAEMPTTLHAMYQPQLHHGELTVTVDVPPYAHATDAQAQLGILLHGLIARGPPSAELVSARARVVADLARATQSHASRAEQAAVDEALLGRWDANADRIRRVSRVTVRSIQERLMDVLGSPRQTSVTVSAAEP